MLDSSNLFPLITFNMHLQGVILYEMLSGSCPFTEEDEVKLREQITTADYVLDKLILDQISDKAQDLIKKLLVVNPEERLSSEQILCHPWLQVTTMGQLRCLNSFIRVNQGNWFDFKS